MATEPQIQPGDLITADFMNALLSSVGDLDTRVTKLEAGSVVPTGGAPVLSSLSPSANVQVNEVLELIGLNFGPFGETTVRIGEVSITQFLTGSNSTALLVGVPALSNLPRTVPITVTTPEGTSNSLQITVAPQPVNITGAVYIDDENTNPPVPQANATAQYQFQVRSETTQPDTYGFTTSVGTVSGSLSQQQWQSAVSLNAPDQLIAPGSPFLVVVSVAVPGTAQVGDTANLTLTATSTDGRFSKTSNAIMITVGQAAAVSDIRIQLNPVAPQPAFDPNGNPNTVKLVTDPNGQKVITVPANSSGFVAVNVVFADTVTAPLSYQFSATLEGTPATWQAGAARPPSLQRAAQGGSTVVNYAITNSAAAGDTAAHDTFMVARAAEGAGPAYQSFSRFLIRNAG